MKRFLRVTMGILLLALSVAATQIPAESLRAATDQNEFQLDGTTLVKYTGTATAVSVPAEVTKIGEEAFRANQTLKSVKLPKNLETIGNGAFSYCSALQQVSIPDSVKEIGAGAFSCCTSLSSFSLGSGTERLGSGILAGCTNLQSIKVNKKNSTFISDNDNLYDRDMTCLYQYAVGKTADSYRLPDSVKKIDKYAFWGCRNLSSIELNSNISAIPGYAFSNCKSLENIQIPYSVKSIDAKAFEDCINLTEVFLPASVTRIHDTAFDGCTHLTLTGEAGSTAETYAKAFNQREKVVQAEYEDLSERNSGVDQQIPVNSAEDSVKGNPVAGNTEDTSTDHANWDGRMLGSAVIRGNQAIVYIDNAVTQVKSGDSQTPETKKEEVQNREEKNAGKLTGEKLSDLTDTETEDSAESLRQSSGADEKGLYLPKYTITAQGDLADQAYYRNKGMTEYTIPSTVTRIGEFAFARSGLTSIVIPEGVKEIGYGAFYHCDQLTQIQFPNSLEVIEPEAFSKTGYLDNYRKNQASSFPFLIVGNGILLDYAGSDGKIEIPEGVTYIAPDVFKGHTEITSVLLPDSLKTIGEGAFEQCTSLTQVQGGSNVKKIQDRAFAGCPLETVRIPDQVESLGLGAFDLTESSLRQDERVVVFHGNIPVVSHEKSAERLSNESYRIRALNGVSYAVVDAAVSMDSLKDTVLDKEQFGFKGIVLSIASDTDRTVQLRGSTLTGEETAALQLPATVEIYGRQYRLLNPETLQELARESGQQKQAQESGRQEQAMGTVRVSGNTENIPVDQVRATIGDTTHAYTLDIQENEGTSGRMKGAYTKAFQADPPADFTVCELTLTEQESGIFISRLGKDAVHISMPVPERCRDGKLFILCTDEDGQLENVSYALEETSSGRIVNFETSHFSDFAFFTNGVSLYAEGNVLSGKVNITQFSTKDVSPDTGDYISPKWILSAGLFFTALAVLFYRRRPKNKTVEK